MNAVPSFEKLKASLAPELEILEKERIKIRNKLLFRMIAITVLIMGICIYLGSLREDSEGWFYIGIVLSAMTIYVLLHRGNDYTFFYKQKIITPFVKALFEDADYCHFGGIDESILTASKLFKKPDFFWTEDFVAGKIGKTSVQFCEVKVEIQPKLTKSEKEVPGRPVIIFKGIMFLADFHKHFNTNTVVRQKQYPRPEKMQRVKLENREFECRFNSYSMDQVEARYILSTSLMERMVELDRKFKSKVQFSFVDSNVLVAINDKRDNFEFNIWRSLYHPSVLKKEYDLIHALIGIVEDLNLNTRIWSKE